MQFAVGFLVCCGTYRRLLCLGQELAFFLGYLVGVAGWVVEVLPGMARHGVAGRSDLCLPHELALLFSYFIGVAGGVVEVLAMLARHVVAGCSVLALDFVRLLACHFSVVRLDKMFYDTVNYW